MTGVLYRVGQLCVRPRFVVIGIWLAAVIVLVDTAAIAAPSGA